MQKDDYKTRQREFLIEFFKNNADKCFTPEEVFRHAKSCGVAIGQTTIYRNLEKLGNEGIVIKHIMPGGAFFQYLKCSDRKEHYHLYCTLCGGVTHMDCDYLDGIFKHIRDEHKFDSDRQKTVFYGQCKKCMGL